MDAFNLSVLGKVKGYWRISWITKLAVIIVSAVVQ
jgi:hypothetical protein